MQFPHQACQVLTKSWARGKATGTQCRGSREPLGSKGHRERPYSAEGRTCWTPGQVLPPRDTCSSSPAAHPWGVLPALRGCTSCGLPLRPSPAAVPCGPGAPLEAATLATLDGLVWYEAVSAKLA